MSSSLSSVPVQRRRHAAAATGLLATLLAAIGVLPWVGAAPGAVRVLSVVALLAAVLLALVAWGLLASTGAERAEARLDAAVASTVADAGAAMCDCGHEHDPDELHVTDEQPCAVGESCPHTCETCVRADRRS